MRRVRNARRDLRDARVSLIHEKSDDEEGVGTAPGRRAAIPRERLVEYVVSTFILVLNRWVERAGARVRCARPTACFRSIVLPAPAATAGSG